MALIIRKNGDMVCAAINKIESSFDEYVGDHMHGLLCDRKLIVTTPEPTHSDSGGQWWWKGEEPSNIKIDPWWYE